MVVLCKKKLISVLTSLKKKLKLTKSLLKIKCAMSLVLPEVKVMPVSLKDSVLLDSQERLTEG